MLTPLSIRKKIIKAVQRGESKVSIARRFEMSVRGIHKLIKHYREHGTLEPFKPGPKKPTKLTPEDDAKMRELIQHNPGITLREIIPHLSVEVAESTVSRRLKKLGITLKKKSLIAKEQQRDDIVQKRINFTIASRFVDPKTLVFLDESGVKTNMTRLYGWAPIGERCRFHIPHGHWKSMTLISAIRIDQVIEEATMLLDGPLTGDIFTEYVENKLSPNLKPGDIVVMDNLSSHKAAGVEKAIANAKADLWYLPAYSPDMNPIEKLWSKTKSCLRRISAGTIEGIISAVKRALRLVTPEECRNYFASCGYGI